MWVCHLAQEQPFLCRRSLIQRLRSPLAWPGGLPHSHVHTAAFVFCLPAEAPVHFPFLLRHKAWESPINSKKTTDWEQRELCQRGKTVQSVDNRKWAFPTVRLTSALWHLLWPWAKAADSLLSQSVHAVVTNSSLSNRRLFLTVLEAFRSPRSRCKPVWFPVRTRLLACQWWPSPCVFTWQRERDHPSHVSP